MSIDTQRVLPSVAEENPLPPSYNCPWDNAPSDHKYLITRLDCILFDCTTIEVTPLYKTEHRSGYKLDPCVCSFCNLDLYCCQTMGQQICYAYVGNRTLSEDFDSTDHLCCKYCFRTGLTPKERTLYVKASVKS